MTFEYLSSNVCLSFLLKSEFASVNILCFTASTNYILNAYLALTKFVSLQYLHLKKESFQNFQVNLQLKSGFFILNAYHGTLKLLKGSALLPQIIICLIPNRWYYKEYIS